MSYQTSDAGAWAGWIVIALFATILGAIARKFKVVRR